MSFCFRVGLLVGLSDEFEGKKYHRRPVLGRCGKNKHVGFESNGLGLGL